MKYLLIIISFFFLSHTYSKESVEKKKEGCQLYSKENQFTIEQPQFSQLKNILDKNESWWEDYLPSIIALITVAISSWTAYIISKKSINANNRQEWINDTRNAIAELTTQATLLNIEFQEKQLNREKFKIAHEKTTFQKNKITLLLITEIPRHKKVIDSLDALLSILDEHLLNSKANNDPTLNIGKIPFNNMLFQEKLDGVILASRELFYLEWNKIQRWFF